MRSPTEETYTELQEAYTWYNEQLFGNRLPFCLITYQREKRTMGYFSGARWASRKGVRTDEIAMNPWYFGTRPIEEVLSTLVHEMVHLWQEHFGDPGRRRYHNREWAEKIKAIGLYPSSTGRPGGSETGEHMSDYIVAGGRFIEATRALLETDFALSWYDRFPPADEVLRAHTRSAAGATIYPWPGGIDDESPSPVPTIAPSGLDESAELVSLEDPADRPAAGPVLDFAVPAPAPAPEQGPGPETAVAQGNRSNRWKYQCPACGINAWGKPRLRLICGECNVELVDVRA